MADSCGLVKLAREARRLGDSLAGTDAGSEMAARLPPLAEMGHRSWDALRQRFLGEPVS
ncbi:hypothetical protein [Nitrospirillum sp. BR 11828]|uniref:hypothetical protein n=1 Tax=Nitrospirillum sp. BR 11828 TaxID=3104325 RepID=UPI002ACA6A27|nr:hypothetical protein [Nitrospirillum sp. BR 11828]MDZ5648700.1 hypothetical protein [Nitrospirillum sp. BR 11828]